MTAGPQANEGKLYLCANMDVFSGRIVNYSIDSQMKTRPAVYALDSVVNRRDAIQAGARLQARC